MHTSSPMITCRIARRIAKQAKDMCSIRSCSDRKIKPSLPIPHTYFRAVVDPHRWISPFFSFTPGAVDMLKLLIHHLSASHQLISLLQAIYRSHLFQIWFACMMRIRWKCLASPKSFTAKWDLRFCCVNIKHFLRENQDIISIELKISNMPTLFIMNEERGLH